MIIATSFISLSFSVPFSLVKMILDHVIKTSFSQGTKYWRFNDRKMATGYPKEISVGFAGIPNDVDTAFVWSGNGKTYFFKGENLSLPFSLSYYSVSSFKKTVSSKREKRFVRIDKNDPVEYVTVLEDDFVTKTVVNLFYFNSVPLLVPVLNACV